MYNIYIIYRAYLFALLIEYSRDTVYNRNRVISGGGEPIYNEKEKAVDKLSTHPDFAAILSLLVFVIEL